VVLACSALGTSGLSLRALRKHRLPLSAEDRRHNARADRMIAEMENSASGSSSALDSLERSVDMRLASTKQELQKVMNFRKKAMKLLQSKIAELAASGDTGTTSQIRAALKAGRRLDRIQLDMNDGSGNTAESADADANASGDVESNEALTDAATDTTTENDANTDADTDSTSDTESDTDAAFEVGVVRDPITELQALDDAELSARDTLGETLDQFESVRFSGGRSSARSAVGLDNGAEAELDGGLDRTVTAQRNRIANLHDQRAILFRQERLRPEHLLRLNLAGSSRVDALRRDLDTLTAIGESAVYNTTPKIDFMGDAFGFRQSLASWRALIAAELATINSPT